MLHAEKTMAVSRRLAAIVVLALLPTLTGCSGAKARPIARSDEVSSARQEAIRLAGDSIRAECQKAAGGDWERWEQETLPFRTALRARLTALPQSPNAEVGPFTSAGGKSQDDIGLSALDGFPLQEMGAAERLLYLTDPASYHDVEQIVLAADRWLRQHGVDLVFVVVPKMTEVYPEHFIRPCPADGVIAPHIRRVLLALLDGDVEVVDGFPLFRASPEKDLLYLARDTHWATPGQQLMARHIAERLNCYDFVVRAKAAPPLADEPIPNDLTASVLLIGNSYCKGFDEQLARALNMPIYRHWHLGETTESFWDMLRGGPEMLKNVRVVIWVTTQQNLPHLRPLPEPILAALSR
jgi:SGNH hydrolase-like domain, acetyltransferase AlgX